MSDRIGLDQSPEAIRAAISENVCPFCGDGPFKSVGAHTAKKHEVTAAELREAAELPRTAVITSEGFHEERSTQQTEVLSRDPNARVRFVEAGHAPEVVESRANGWDRAEARRKHLAARRTEEAKQRFRDAVADVDWSEAAKNRSPDAVRRQTERVQAARDAWLERVKDEERRAAYAEGRKAYVERVGMEAVREHARHASSHVTREQRLSALEKAHEASRQLHQDPERHSEWHQATIEAARDRRQLDGKDVREIKWLLETTDLSTDEIGELFDCSRALVNKVRRGERDHFMED